MIAHHVSALTLDTHEGWHRYTTLIRVAGAASLFTIITLISRIKKKKERKKNWRDHRCHIFLMDIIRMLPLPC